MFGIEKKLKFYPKNRERVKWKVPGLFEHDRIIFKLHDICESLEIKQPIAVAFGGITSKWHAGRPPQIESISEKELYSLLEQYNKRNIACHFTFSNYYVRKSHLDDNIGNLVCRVLENIDFPNTLIISSNLLQEYVKEKYPKIKQTASVIKPMYEAPKYDETPDYYNKLCKKFDFVCIRPEFNTDKSFLRHLKYKNKIELLVNQTCFYKCPLSRFHYDKSAKCTTNNDKYFKEFNFCQNKGDKLNSIYEHLSNSSEQIDKMVGLGFENFKLQGRCAPPMVFLDEIIGRYVFEPTGYFTYIKNKIINELKLR